MVNNYVLICNKKIIDIFYNQTSYPVFAPKDLSGNSINCILLENIVLNENEIPEIGDSINENNELIKFVPEIIINLDLELPELEENNDDFESSIIEDDVLNA